MATLFEREDRYTGPPVDDALIREAEARLGYTLPRTYTDLLRSMNGGVLRRRCCPTPFPTSWAVGHFEIRTLLGIGGTYGIDAGDGYGSQGLVEEWGYPDVGVVICDMPSGGPDTVMLDYRDCGPNGEPTVVYVDEDRIPKKVADSFGQFLEKLTECPDD